MICIVSFYKFVDLEQVQALRERVYAQGLELGIYGTVLLATEGINATICAPEASIKQFIAWLEAQSSIGAVAGKYSYSSALPFKRWRVKHKQQILSFRHSDANPKLTSGERIAPEHWNKLLAEEDILLLDVRNDYEVKLGKFTGATNPQLSNFAEFAAYVDNELSDAKQRPVAMYCTGGIRCEKSSAYMLNRGFDKVYQLEGGILAYIEQVPQPESLWQGECFVFDQRVSVDSELRAGSHSLCYACREPLSAADREHPHYQSGISCPSCYERKSDADRARYAMRHSQQ